MRGLVVDFFIASIAGLFSFISPCILPMIPIFLGSLATNSKNQLISTLYFCAGITLAFCLLGATASGLGTILFQYQVYIQFVLGIALVIMGLHSLHWISIPWMDRTIKIDQVNSTGLTKSFLMGFTFAFGWSPCVGPILGSILALAASSETVWRGIFMLASYSFGICLPLIVFSALTDTFSQFYSVMKNYFGILERIGGVFLLIIGTYYVLQIFA